MPPGDMNARVGTLEKKVAVIENFNERVDGDLYNHGSDGLKTQFTSFIAAWEEGKKLREEAEKNRRQRMGWGVSIGVVILGSILTWMLAQVIPAAKAILDEYYERHPKAAINRNSSENTTQSVYANQQSAHIPKL